MLQALIIEAGNRFMVKKIFSDRIAMLANFYFHQAFCGFFFPALSRYPLGVDARRARYVPTLKRRAMRKRCFLDFFNIVTSEKYSHDSPNV